MTIAVITVGVDTYTEIPAWNIEEIRGIRDRIEQLFIERGAHPENWSADAADLGLINKALESWVARTSQSHIFYWIGHGEWDGNDYLLALADSSEPLSERNSFACSQLAGALRDQLDRRQVDECLDNWVLVILDTCGSGPGAWELFSSFPRGPTNVGIIAAAREGAAYTGRLADVLVDLLSTFTPNDSAGIKLLELMRRLEDNPSRSAGLETYYKFSPSAVIRPLPEAPPPIQATVDVYRELRDVLNSASPELRNHFYAKAQGTEIGELAWHFTGRIDERRRTSNWLQEANDGMFVVTGLAGSGKSAMLGMLLATANNDVISALDRIGYDPIPEDVRPSGVKFDAVIHARGRTVNDIVASLSAAFDLDATDDLDALIEDLHTRESRTTILIDAVDESRDPLTIAAAIRRIASASGVRVLVGTRQSTHEDPDHPIPTDSAILDALAAPPEFVLRLQSDRDAVRTYVSSRLTAAIRGIIREDRIAHLSDVVAGYDQPFLFARLAVRELIAELDLTYDDDKLGRVLGSGHSGILAHAVMRLADTAPRAEALLHALAYARGNGFPRTGGIWAIAGSAVFGAGKQFRDADVEEALDLAAPFIMQDTEFGDSVYRLAHRTFTEWYRTARHEYAGRDAFPIADQLLTRAEELAANGDALDPYLRAYLAEHVGETELWRQLSRRIRVLDELDPDAVAHEAMRAADPLRPPPPAVLTTMVAHLELHHESADTRSLIRALAAARLRLEDRDLSDPRLRWTHLEMMVPHLPLSGHLGVVTALEFGMLADGRTLLASAGVDKTIRLWDPITGADVGEPLIGHTDAVLDIAFGPLPDGRYALASCSADRSIRLWDPVTGHAIGHPLVGHKSDINAITFVQMPNGKTVLASGSSDETIRIWDLTTNTIVRELDRHTGPVTTLAARTLPDGRSILASGGADMRVFLWDVGDPKSFVVVFEGHTDTLTAVTFGEFFDGSIVLASAAREDSIQMWSVDDGEAIGTITLNDGDWVRGLTFARVSRTQTLLATAGPDNKVELWNPQFRSIAEHPLTGHSESVEAVAFGTSKRTLTFSPSARVLLASESEPEDRLLLASGGHDGIVRLWFQISHIPLDPDPSHHGTVSTVALCPLLDGRQLVASAGDDDWIRLWDAADGSPRGQAIRGHTETVNSLTFSNPSANGLPVLASASDDGFVRVWDFSDHLRTQKSQMYHGCPVFAVVAFDTPSGQVVASGAEDGVVRLWDAMTGALINGNLVGHTRAISAIATTKHPDGRTILASSGADTTIRLWDATTGTAIGDPLTDHADAVEALAFGMLPNGTPILASGDANGTVRLWEPKSESTAAVCALLNAHDGRVAALTFETLFTRTMLITAGWDCTLRVWDASDPAKGPIRTCRISPSQPRAIAARHLAAYVGCTDGIIALNIR